MICFQIVFYRSLKHRRRIARPCPPCCDLLSNCILSIFETPRFVFKIWCKVLWFAFKLYFIDLWNTIFVGGMIWKKVVICFQIVFYRSLKHLHFVNTYQVYGCDLLSNCILSIFETPREKGTHDKAPLWFAFKLYFIDLWNTPLLWGYLHPIVVICFQIVFYRSLKHLVGNPDIGAYGCDLLSNCILSIFETPFRIHLTTFSLLWFAFKLYFIDLWNTFGTVNKGSKHVVICFQIVFYRSLKHLKRKRCRFRCSCDLLSNCILSIFETPRRFQFATTAALWFAFKLYFIDLWNT